MKDLKTEINSNPNGLKTKIYNTYVENFIEQFENTDVINASVNNFRSDINYGTCKITIADIFNPTPELSGDVTEFEYEQIKFKHFEEFVKYYDGCSFFIVSDKIKVDNEALEGDYYKIPNKLLYRFYEDFTTRLSSIFDNGETETISINGKKYQISDDYTFKIGTDYYIS